MPATRLTLTLSLVLGAGCATAPGGKMGGSDDFDRTLVEVRAQNAGYQRQIDELNNKVLMLEDAIESRRPADEETREAPRLVSKRIGVPQPRPAPAREYPAETCVASEDPSVEYAGEAALPVRRERDRERMYARPILRLSGSGYASSISTASPRGAESGLADGSDPREALGLYRRSLKAMHTGHVGKAITGFREFLARYPHHNYADNAQYWIAEGYYDLKQFRSAVREYRHVVERYPHGNKVPDSMLKLGLSELEIGDRNDARRVLESLRRIYPRQPAARAAAEHLAQAGIDVGDDKAPATVSLDLQRR